MAAGGAAGGDPLDVEDVFKAHPYLGNGSSGQTVTTGIDIATNGGTVFLKGRSIGNHSIWWDANAFPNGNKWIYANGGYGSQSLGENIFGITSSGFSIAGGGTNSDSQVFNGNSREYISLNFRKAPKFFDSFTFTGNGQDGREIAHNLGSVPGMIYIQRIDGGQTGVIWHRSVTNVFQGFDSNAAAGISQLVFGNTAPTATHFTLDHINSSYPNHSGQTYIAYLWAHNNNDGGFGPLQDQDIIKCGVYSGDGQEDGSNAIDLGFQPQFLLIKRATGGTGSWNIFDEMRGLTNGIGNNDNVTRTLALDKTLEEYDEEFFQLNYNGFALRSNKSDVNSSGSTYAYMAIRKGPLSPPENGADVFSIASKDTAHPSFNATFDRVDMAINKGNINGSWDHELTARLMQNKQIKTNSDSAQGTAGSFVMDFANGYAEINSASSTHLSWMWKQAPEYFDVQTYIGQSSNKDINHNLKIVPEMAWFKQRDASKDWAVFHKDFNKTNGQMLYLNYSNATSNRSNIWASSSNSITSSIFRVGQDSLVNSNNGDFIAFFFGTVAGVSKVGSYTGNETERTIDCGFSNGAKFVLIKESNNNNYWFLYDSFRGISTNTTDPAIFLDQQNAQDSEGGNQFIKPDSSGFIVGSPGRLNNNGGTFIFYAIAA